MIKVLEVVKHFEVNLKPIDGLSNLDNEITKPGLNRLGFELCGFFVDKKIKNIVVFGNREYTYLINLNQKERDSRIHEIFKLQPPMILLTKSFKEVDFLKKINKFYQIPIIKSDMFSNDIASSIGALVSESLAKYETMHAVLLEVYGEGVLLIGESGIGKSEIAMEMIKKNHLFIADDAVDIARIGGVLLGKSNKIAKNFIEIRGLGILNISKMFGVEKIKPSTIISVVIELKAINFQNYDFDRLGNDQQNQIICGLKLPKYTIPISPGRKISDLIESVVIDLKLKREGYNATNDFLKQHHQIMKIETKNQTLKNKSIFKKGKK
ncbi:HPr(Ser) kinase/phosphatase [Mycoplasmoides alvi]|uniref:HPr(Ser) kinase/phosphatase n=1 Tax=Mycoplasmoides alvi TaxID=78580 RepID=UPI000A05D8FE|nr:HPr(Ser) kinase/phosphatase [Mycoplasmoides alvi]